MKQFHRRRPAPTRAQFRNQLRKVVQDANHLLFIPPVSRDQLQLFSWVEEDVADLQDAA